MKRIELPNGLTAFRTSTEELFSIGGLGICDHCNEYHSEGGYLIPVLNHWICSKCYKEWKERAIRYPEDDEFEQRYIRIYENLIPVEE